ncbi:PREDICTED: BRICHOS domain-containing protein 5 [Chlamydotis macqueenii]|uniref:BRICHOS domain-containing protein 5 n=1 Tax=Chlamydotis macqueenii TaxID=187382 RepID=UPI00052A01A6|nr:PREDICTED: BRICHOS domain-containing protein 5 [Chlamydotis macqueenii]
MHSLRAVPQERGPRLRWRMEGGSGTGEAVSAGRRAAARFTAPSRRFWIVLSVALFFAVVGISVVGVLSFSPSAAQAGSQLGRLTLQGQPDPPRNQTALVDQSRSTVTYYITSQSNHTAVVLYDSRNGYVCYKPTEQRACYLRRMDAWDLQTLQTSLDTSEQRADQLLGQNNQTKYYREFLGILAGEEVDPKNLGEAVQTLCEQTAIFWVRRGEASCRGHIRFGNYLLGAEAWSHPRQTQLLPPETKPRSIRGDAQERVGPRRGGSLLSDKGKRAEVLSSRT